MVNYLDVNKEEQPHLYRICHDLLNHKRSHIDTSKIDNWESVSRTFGLKARDLINRDEPLLFPIARTKKCRKDSFALIQIPFYVNIEHIKKGNGIHRFRFFKK